MHCKKNKGFSLLETMLAVIAVMIAGMGIYAVFSSGLNNNDLNSASSEMVEIANVYTDLASADLTSGLDGTTIETLLQNTGRLSSHYFIPPDGDTEGVSMVNKFGGLKFYSVSAYGFKVLVPLGNSGSPSEQFCKQLSDMYTSCDDTTDNQAVLTFDLTT